MPAAAVPAKPGITMVQQADGTELPVRIMGDERSHFYLSDDGYLLINDKDTYYYGDVDAQGDIVRSNIRATASQLRDGVARQFVQQVDMNRVYERLNARAAAARNVIATASADGPRKGPGLFAETNFPAKGHQKAIVVLVEYTDTKFQVEDPHSYFSRMLNEPGFSDYGGTGSAVDFFRENSLDQFIPEFDVFGPITLSQKMSYYGGNDWYGDDQRPEEMIIEACQLLDDSVDFSEYDRDGDGYIDNVFVFYAGRGEASGGSSDTVWPHSWNITAATYTPYYFDGVRLDRYGCSNEWEGTRPDGVGTFVHEFSHVMGLPDLYATSYTSAFTPGAWSALDYGPYNNDGCTPPMYSAFERYALDWVEPLPIDGPINATLNPIATNQCGIIRTSKDNEFFLVENRQQTSWDAYIPGHGMLIWHIDYNSSVWSSNKVNNTSSHQYVDLEEADGTQSEYSRDGDSFPGTSGKTSFTDDTTPSMKTWAGQKLNLPITDIAESSDGIITFKVCGGREPMQPTVAEDADEVSADGFTAHWQAIEDEDASYILNVYSLPEGDALRAPGDKQYLEGYKNLNVGKVTSYAVTGTEAGMEYFYTISVGDGWEQSEPSAPVSVVTGKLPMDRRSIKATAATEVTTSGFTANWEAVDDADSYLLSVYTKEWGAPIIDVCDFTDGVNKLPEGWTSTSAASYANAAYSGEAVPALRLSTVQDVLTTPVYTEGIRTFSFWHRGNGSTEGDVIVVEAFAAEQWSKIAEVAVVKEKGGATTELTDEIPGGTSQMRIYYKRTGGKGALALDDVKVGYSETSAAVPVEGLTDVEVGNVTSYAVTDLNDATEYFYTVRAADADGVLSKASNEIAVTTEAGQGNSGIADVASDTLDTSAPVDVYDMLGRHAGRFESTDAARATLAPGIYILKQNKLTTKIAIK